MSKIATRRQLAFCVMLFCVLLSARPSYSADAESDASAFYAGKQIRFITMGSPGGGYDIYMRTLIPYLEKSLNARIIPYNESNAGGLIAMNQLLNAPADGLTILLTGGEGMVTAQLYRIPGVNYNARQLVYLGRLSSDVKVVAVGPKSPFFRLRDMLSARRPIIWAGTGKTDGNSDFSSILSFAMGLKSKTVIGYGGTGAINLAIESGEADARVVSEETAALSFRGNTGRIIGTLASKRAPMFPEAPTVFEDVPLSERGRRMLLWRAGIADLGRVILVTPGSPRPRVDFLRHAIAEAMQSPAFKADIKADGLSVDYEDAESLKKSVDAALAYAESPDFAETIDIATERYYSH